MKRFQVLVMLFVGVAVCSLTDSLWASESKDDTPPSEWEWLIEPVDIHPDGASVAVDFVVFTQFPGEELEHLLGGFCIMGTTLHAALKESEETKKHFRAAGIDPSGKRVNFVPRGALMTGDGMAARYFRVQRDEDEGTSERTHAAYITKLGLVYQPEASDQEKQGKCADKLKQANLVMTLPQVDKAFSFSVELEKDRRLDLDDYRGKVVLIDWWATWCSPCLDKMPWLMDLSRRLEPEGLVVISVNLDESHAQGLRTLERFHLADSIVQRWRSLGLIDGNGSVEQNVLAGLRGRLEGLTTDNERLVVSALEHLGVMDRLAAERGDIFKRLGISWTLYHVPENVRECFGILAGESFPTITIVGPDGILRYHGFPVRPQVEEMIENLLPKD